MRPSAAEVRASASPAKDWPLERFSFLHDRLWIPLTLGVGAFAVDLLTPSGVGEDISYVVALFGTLWARPLRAPIHVAAVLTLFLLLGYVLSPPTTTPPTVALTSRAAVLVVLWVVAVLLTNRARGEAAERASAGRLRESEERFRTLANNISQFAWMADEKGWIYWYNERWYEYTGTTLEQMQGWGWRSVHHPDHVDRVVTRIRHSWDTGEPWEDTFPLRGRDGRYRWFLSRAVPIRDEAGRIVRWFGTNTDITERKEAEEKLRESEERARFLVRLGDAMRSPDDPQAIVTAAMEQLRVYLGAHQTFYAVFDADGEHVALGGVACAPGMIPLPSWARFPLAAFGPEAAEALRAGRPIVYADLTAEWQQVGMSADLAAFAAAHGVRAALGVPLLRAGHLVAALSALCVTPRRWKPEEIALVQEVAERCWEAVVRARTAVALAASEARYRALFEHTAEYRLVLQAERDAHGVTREWVCRDANVGALKVLGMRREELLDRPMREVMPRDRAARLYELCASVAASQQSLQHEGWYGGANFLMVFFPIGAGGVGISGIDITERTRAEEHRELLVRELSHRVKNTLAIVQAIASQTLRQARSLDDFGPKFTGRVSALAAAHDLLLREGWQPVGLRDLIEQALAPHRILSEGAARVTLGGPPVLITAPIAVSLAMVLHELATNAAKYGALSRESGEVRVRWRRRAPGTGQPSVELMWRERGGPPVAAPSRTGFGSHLLQSVSREFGEQVALAFEPEGLECRIRVPLAEAPAASAAE